LTDQSSEALSPKQPTSTVSTDEIVPSAASVSAEDGWGNWSYSYSSPGEKKKRKEIQLAVRGKHPNEQTTQDDSAWKFSPILKSRNDHDSNIKELPTESDPTPDAKVEDDWDTWNFGTKKDKKKKKKSCWETNVDLIEEDSATRPKQDEDTDLFGWGFLATKTAKKKSKKPDAH